MGMTEIYVIVLNFKVPNVHCFEYKFWLKISYSRIERNVEFEAMDTIILHGGFASESPWIITNEGIFFSEAAHVTEML